MRAQRELFERQIELESAELAITPEEEFEELALIYRAKGIPQEDAESLARHLLQDRGVALDTLVREELGLDPRELGSPWGAAIGSFLAFAIGALLPVIPFFFGASTALVVLSVVIAGLALFAVGAAVSIFTGRNFVLSGLRQLAIGGAAAALTFGLGKVIGVSTGI
jgi:VIT1/CCC1 family predicted Fe2+/Mn2+ transporter